MTTYLISGANRGIGLAMTQQLAARGDTVLALCRQPDTATDLVAVSEKMGNIVILQGDVADEASIEAAANMARDQVSAIDTIINNAGMLVRTEVIDGFDGSIMRKTFDVNVIGVMNVIKHFLPFLRNGANPRIVNISSQLGSLAEQGQFRSGIYSYNASKAALNMMTRMLAHDLLPERIIVVSIHPGWVQTDMGGASAAITPTVSAEGIIAVSDSLTLSDTNQFYTYNGSKHAW